MKTNKFKKLIMIPFAVLLVACGSLPVNVVQQDVQSSPAPVARDFSPNNWMLQLRSGLANAFRKGNESSCCICANYSTYMSHVLMQARLTISSPTSTTNGSWRPFGGSLRGGKDPTLRYSFHRGVQCFRHAPASGKAR